MCGIVGLIGPKAGDAALDAVEHAVDALGHRGPDGNGVHVSGAALLGHTRLSIVDLEGGSQPLANEDGSVVTVFNGEIWNHLDLRPALEHAGHRFRTRSDTEVLVHAYEEWGDAMVERLNGMFAFALWDNRRGRLLLARDRVGKKPLYVARESGGLAFGSDARSVLLALGRTPELAAEYVPEFLFQRYVSAPRTLFRGVEKLPPGHLLVHQDGRTTVRPYWRLDPGDEEALSPVELRELLVDSVRLRLMSDVPLGVLLSGGVDSTAVLGLMTAAGASDVSSFTIGFADPIYDERPLARLAAERHGTEHHEVVVDAPDFLQALPRLAWYRDEPIAEPSEIPLLLLAELAGRHVKVVLSGDGGDELFGGYPKYRAERILRAAPFVPRSLFGIAGRALGLGGTHRRLDRAVETLSYREELVRWASWFRSFGPTDLEQLLAPRLRPLASPATLVEPLRRLLEPYAGLDKGRRMLVGDLLTYLPDNMLLRSDKVLMAASLEGRMPLLDYRIVERVSKAPISQRAALRAPKGLLRKAVGDLVPPEVLAGPKRGFPVPVARFLVEDESRSLERLVLSERSLDRGLFAPDALRALVHGEDVVERELKLFTVASLELWLRANVDEVRLQPPSGLDELLETADAGAAASLTRR
jgi:asparagine synthase (glutamine-hydrolysing)